MPIVIEKSFLDSVTPLPSKFIHSHFLCQKRQCLVIVGHLVPKKWMNSLEMSKPICSTIHFEVYFQYYSQQPVALAVFS